MIKDFRKRKATFIFSSGIYHNIAVTGETINMLSYTKKYIKRQKKEKPQESRHNFYENSTPGDLIVKCLITH